LFKTKCYTIANRTLIYISVRNVTAKITTNYKSGNQHVTNADA